MNRAIIIFVLAISLAQTRAETDAQPIIVDADACARFLDALPILTNGEEIPYRGIPYYAVVIAPNGLPLHDRPAERLVFSTWFQELQSRAAPTVQGDPPDEQIEYDNTKPAWELVPTESKVVGIYPQGTLFKVIEPVSHELFGPSLHVSTGWMEVAVQTDVNQWGFARESQLGYSTRAFDPVKLKAQAEACHSITDPSSLDREAPPRQPDQPR